MAQRVKKLFITTDGQIANVRRWIAKHEWRFTKEDLRALPPPPPWPEQPLGAVILVPYFDTPGETLMELWIAAFGRLKMCWNDERLPPEEREVRLHDGIAQPKGLRWEVIDLGAQIGMSPVAVRGHQTAHAGILAAAAHFKRWAKALGRSDVPNVWLGGYRAALPATKHWSGTPCLIRSGYKDHVSLSVQPADKAHPRSAVPLLLDVRPAA